MTFKTTATVAAVLTCLLGVAYLAAGEIMVGRWQVEPTEGVLLLGRRIGAYFLGLSVMFFLARPVVDPAARRALSSSAVVTCALLATLGTRDYLAGRAAAPILASAALEVLLALVFARQFLSAHALAQAGTRPA